MKSWNQKNESYEYVVDTLDYCGIPYTYKAGAHMFWLHGNKDYAYYWTTGRWNSRGTYKKHYYSRGLRDFLVRFFEPGEL